MAANLSPDDLLVLREVARKGHYLRAGEALGLNHTTIARRIGALERALGGKVVSRSTSGWELTPLGSQAVDAANLISRAMDDLSSATHGTASKSAIEDTVRISTPDAFAVHIAAPAAAKVHRRHEKVSIEIISATRRATAHRSGLDIEVVVGEPAVLRAKASRLATYDLGLYAATTYLSQHSRPSSVADLEQHRLVYFIGSMLQLDSLDVGRKLLPNMADAVTSTNVFAHIEATIAGAGIGLLPTFLASTHPPLNRILAESFDIPLDYWIVTRPDDMRRPAVRSLYDEIKVRLSDISDPRGHLR